MTAAEATVIAAVPPGWQSTFGPLEQSITSSSAAAGPVPVQGADAASSGHPFVDQHVSCCSAVPKAIPS